MVAAVLGELRSNEVAEGREEGLPRQESPVGLFVDMHAERVRQDERHARDDGGGAAEAETDDLQG